MGAEEVHTESDGNAKAAKLPKRARGAGFPSMPLAEAVAMVKKIASYGTTHTNAAVASFLGHTTANSGPYRSKIAALKDYGLLTGRGDDLTVAPLALEIAHPGFDADPQNSLRAAFHNCKLFTVVYEALPKDRELEISSLANSAMHNHGVAAQSKDTFASVFVKSGVTAGLIEELDAAHVRLHDAKTSSAVEEHDEGDSPARVEDEGRATSSPAVVSEPIRASTTAVVNHAWPITGGTIRFTIESSSPLPAAAYAVIGTVISAGDKLAEMLGETEVSVEVAGDSE